MCSLGRPISYMQAFRRKLVDTESQNIFLVNFDGGQVVIDINSVCVLISLDWKQMIAANKFLFHFPECLNIFSLIICLVMYSCLYLCIHFKCCMVRNLESAAAPEINKNVFHHFFPSQSSQIVDRSVLIWQKVEHSTILSVYPIEFGHYYS